MTRYTSSKPASDLRPPPKGPAPGAASEAIAKALRGNVPALRRMGVMIARPPWWRRRLQRVLAPKRYRLWLQGQVLNQVDESSLN